MAITDRYIRTVTTADPNVPPPSVSSYLPTTSLEHYLHSWPLNMEISLKTFVLSVTWSSR